MINLFTSVRELRDLGFVIDERVPDYAFTHNFSIPDMLTPDEITTFVGLTRFYWDSTDLIIRDSYQENN